MTYDEFQALVKSSLVLLDEKAENEDIDDADLEEWLLLLHEAVDEESEKEDE